MASMSTFTIRCPTPAEARHEYGLELETVGCIAARRCIRGGGRAPRVRREAARRLFAKVVRGGCFIDVKSQFDMAALQRGRAHGLAVVNDAVVETCRPDTRKSSSVSCAAVLAAG